MLQLFYLIACIINWDIIVIALWKNPMFHISHVMCYVYTSYINIYSNYKKLICNNSMQQKFENRCTKMQFLSNIYRNLNINILYNQKQCCKIFWLIVLHLESKICGTNKQSFKKKTRRAYARLTQNCAEKCSLKILIWYSQENNHNFCLL